jgi:hypothetical protein
MHKLRISGVVLKGFRCSLQNLDKSCESKHELCDIQQVPNQSGVAKYYANAVNQDPHAPGLFTNPVNTGRTQPGLDRNPEESCFYSEEVASPNASC